jgi:transposase-like protein
MVLEALSPGASPTRVARKYGLHRNAVHAHMNRAVRDPERRWRDAEAEAAFRKKVYEMTR